MKGKGMKKNLHAFMLSCFHAFMQRRSRVLILSAPSGSGKTTITRYLLEQFPELEFSISATTRVPRGEEKDGVDYYFLTPDTFREKIACGELLEWEEVYPGKYYGTPLSEVTRIGNKGHVMVCDIDVKGGVNVKKIFGQQALAVFIQPPSIDELQKRLQTRGTDTPESIACRVDKAREELTFASQFDVVIVNDVLETALQKAEQVVKQWLVHKGAKA